MFSAGNPHYQERVQLWKSGGRQVAERLFEYVPFSIFPWQISRYFLSWGLNPYTWLTPSLKGVLRKHSFTNPDVLIFDEPRLAGLEKVIRPGVLIYRSTDLYAEMENDPRVRVVEKWLLDQADAIMAMARPVLDRLKEGQLEKPELLMENGVDYQHFATPASEPSEYPEIPRPRAVYAGAIDNRFDFAVLETLLAARPRFSLVLIGAVSVPVPPSLSENPRVFFLGPKPYGQLPGYLQHAALGLLPLNGHPANEGRSPMKLYEYAAAGLPVLARATPELSRRNLPFCLFYSDPQKLPDLQEQSWSGAEKSVLARETAGRQDWENKAGLVLEFLQSLVLKRKKSGD
jgi:glycosyltransferase involved in cell wall biosynthesis